MKAPASPQSRRERKREEYAYVLDFFEAESTSSRRGTEGTVAQLVGEEHFILLEGLVVPSASVEPSERVYIGGEEREKIATVLRRLDASELTSLARSELTHVVELILEENQDRWIDLFNDMKPLTPKLHSLELLPGVGKKTMWKIVREREKGEFTSYRNVKERVGIDLVNLLKERISEELETEQKYNLFVHD